MARPVGSDVFPIEKNSDIKYSITSNHKKRTHDKYNSCASARHAGAMRTDARLRSTRVHTAPNRSECWTPDTAEGCVLVWSGAQRTAEGCALVWSGAQRTAEGCALVWSRLGPWL